MSAATLLQIWRAECGRAPALLDAASGFKNKGLRLDERALVRIGVAIERLAEEPDYRKALTQMCFVIRGLKKPTPELLKACEGAEAVIAKRGMA